MRRLFVSLLLLLACGFAFSRGSGVVRHYPLNYSGVVDVNYPGTATAGWNFDATVGSTYANDYGTASATMTVGGTPVKVEDMTWPEGLSGTIGSAWRFSGSQDLTRTDDGTFDPAGDFSIQFAVTPTSVTGSQVIASKYATSGNQRGWVVYMNGANLNFLISDDGTSDGGHQSVLSKSSVFAIHRPAFCTVAYDYVTDGTSEAYIYCDNLSTASSTTFNGPVHNSTSSFDIGEDGDGISQLSGDLSHLVFYDQVEISEGQHDHMFDGWQGRLGTTGTSVAISSAAPPAILLDEPSGGNQPFLVDMPANSFMVGSPASGSGGLFGGKAVTNLCQRSTFESFSAGSPLGWTETSGGTSDATQDTTNTAHLASGASMLCDGSNSLSLDSACVTLSASTAYYASAYLKTTSGTADFYVQLIEYTSADCSSGATTTTLYNGNPGSSWINKGDTRTTGGSVQSGRVRLLIDTNSATVIADAVQLHSGSTPMPYCGADTDASVICNHVIVSINSPASANGTIQFQVTARSPVAGVDMSGNEYIFTDGNAGAANSYNLVVNSGSDEPIFYVYDSAGVSRYVTPNVSNWAADTDYTLEAYADGNGNLGLYWNSAWDESESGAGTGKRSASQTTLYLGGTNSAGENFWIRDFVVYRRILR